MSTTASTPADSAGALFVLARDGVDPFFADSLGELLALADLCLSAYALELYACGSAICTELPPVQSLDLGVYALPLAA